MSEILLPKLFQKSSTGAIKVWMVKVVDNEIVACFGQVGGKKQIDRQTIHAGKNIGKSNETTPAEQALIEAQSKWDRKAKKGYVTDYDKAVAGEVDATVIAGGLEPMLAQSYAKHGHKITYPAMVQRKLDGHRCVAIVNADSTVSLWSRTRKPITGVPHIAREIEALGLTPGTALDGEMYHHDYRAKFEQLTSFIRQATPKPGHEIVQYHIYDIASMTDAPFSHRANSLDAIIPDSHATLVKVETLTVDDEEAMREQFALFLAEGYEGLMVRDIDSLYLNKRSYGLQKVKEFADAEFEIVDVLGGKGRMEGRGVFQCVTANGDQFAAKMVGALDDLAEYLTNKDAYIGRMLTVQYQDLTADGLPRFPVALRLRQDV